jgi:hypothetical protein
MTEQFYCDECNNFGYVYFDNNRAEVIESCLCPKLLSIGEIN